ncbi:hypothetical protein IEQ34_020564 [Dendrobium chrysotoxum]|uniref:Uncharacterized protein n=1 Tax=Dendrobium chrysotoxum TaxID=161865 RepID=A0AAV7G2E9_DENCH|nr:hypothetical protein IEQ34_020564 [Dendrobium chrysotoxum]
MAMPGHIESPRPPFLWHPAHIKRRPHQIKSRHCRLANHRLHLPRLRPIHHRDMHRWNESCEPHCGEEEGAEGPVGAMGEFGGKEGEDGENGEEGDGGEVEEAPAWGAQEGVGDGREEGRGDHDGDAGVVEAVEEEVQASRMAAEEVAEGGGYEADHGSKEEDEERPTGRGGVGCRPVVGRGDVGMEMIVVVGW